MQGKGGSSASRRSAGGARGERPSSSTQRFFAAKVGDERDGAAPRCHCGVYVVLYLSRTANNPNRLFFGSPFFKIKLGHCKFFLWLDQHAAKYGRCAATEGVNDAPYEIDEHFMAMNIENRVHDLEDRVAVIEKKSRMNWFLYAFFVFVAIVAVYFR